MTICRRTSTNRMALANGIVTQPSLTCCLPMPPLSLICLSGCCAVSLPPISFIFASHLPFIIHGLPFYSRHKDFMPKGSFTVATNCRYCNKPHGMKAGAETHPAWMPREFPLLLLPHLCSILFYKRQVVFPFLLLFPTHLRNRTNSSSKRHSSFIGSNIPKDEE